MEAALRQELPQTFLGPLLANTSLSEKEKTMQIIHYLQANAKNAIIRDNATTLTQQLPLILDTFTLIEQQTQNPAKTDRAAAEVSCIVCLTHLPTLMCWPCRHLTFCFGCKEKVTQNLTLCPICREPFTELIDVKLP